MITVINMNQMNPWIWVSNIFKPIVLTSVDAPHKKSIKIPLVHLPKRGHWIELRHQLVPIQGRRLDVGMGPMGAQYLKNIDHVIGTNPCPINHQQLNKGTEEKKNMSMYPCFFGNILLK